MRYWHLNRPDMVISMPEPRVAVFTSAARNYLPKVRVLFDSLERHHPEWHRQLVLVEREVDVTDKALANAHSLRCVADLGIPRWEPWSFCHQLVELATAVKPFALKQLLASGEFDVVLYLDPDIAVFSPLDDILDSLAQASIVLSPHQLTPESTLGRVMDNEILSLRHGTYNLGFLGVSCDAVGEAFAEWWSQRLYLFCRDDPAQGLFTDQKWADLIPALFPAVGILRSPRHNVASWNLSERQLSHADDRYWIDGEPLGFYHFTSLSSDSHELMVAKNSDNPPALRQLIRWYRTQEDARKLDAGAGWTFAAYSDGALIPKQHRRAFRDSRELQLAHSDPYAARGLPIVFRDRPHLLKAPETDQQPVSALSTGFAVDQASFDGAKTLRLLTAALKDPGSLGKIAKQTVGVLGREGLQGVLRRLR